MHSTTHDRPGGIDFSSLRVPGLLGCEHLPGEFALQRVGGFLGVSAQTTNVERRASPFKQIKKSASHFLTQYEGTVIRASRDPDNLIKHLS